MEKSVLKASKREELKKNNVKPLRNTGFIPAVIYGRKKDNINIYVKNNEYEKSLRSEFLRNTILKIEIENGESEYVVTYDLQRNVVNRAITHIDFLRVAQNEKVKLNVPIHFIGVAPGTKKGGLLIKKMKFVLVECIPSKLPATVNIDLTKLDVGQFIAVKDIPQDEFAILSDPDNSIVRVEEPKRGGMSADSGEDSAEESTEASSE